jgi:diguanylate cyclase (GGDEF)-like protein
LNTIVAIALGIALTIALGGLGLTYFAGRSRDSSAKSRRASTRTSRRSSELEEELREAQDEIRRTRHLAMLTETFDLDELLGRILQAAAALADGDAGAVALWQETGPPLIKSMNLPPEEAPPVLLGAWQQEGRARAATIRYRSSRAETAVKPAAVHLGVVLPLANDRDVQVGALGVFWRRAVEEPSEHQIAALEELAGGAGRAIENVRSFNELRERAERDPLSGLHNRRYFHEALAQEVSRAHRHDRHMALFFFDLDDFKAINEAVGHLGGDAVLAAVGERLSTAVRASDIACRVGGDEFAVILPESSVGDAEHLFLRLQLAIQAQPISRVENLRISAGMAELRRSDDATSLFRRADEALQRAKRAGKGRVVAADDVEPT